MSNTVCATVFDILSFEFFPSQNQFSLDWLNLQSSTTYCLASPEKTCYEWGIIVYKIAWLNVKHCNVIFNVTFWQKFRERNVFTRDGFTPECKAIKNQILFWLLSWRIWVAVWNLAPFVALIIFKTNLSWEWAEVSYQKSAKIQTAIQNQNDSN